MGETPSSAPRRPETWPVPPVRIAPDTYSRNSWIRRAVEAFFAAGETPAVLDVGGSGGTLAEFLHDVAIVDLRAGADVDVMADARRLPFADRSFDVVCCSDVLEHVPESGRADLVRELLRVASRLVVIAGPYRAPDVELAEQALREFHRYCTNGISHHWLDEHMRHGLPALDWIEREIERAGYGFHRLSSNNIHNWILFQLLIFLNMFDLDAQVADFFEDYNRNLEAYADADGSPYRWVHAIPVGAGRADALAELARDSELRRGAAATTPPVLLAKAFAAIADAMAVKNTFIHQQHRELVETRAVLDSVLHSKSWKMTAPLRTVLESARQLSDVPRRLAGREPRAREPSDPAREVRKAVLFVSGCPGDAKRYRCDHQAEQLGLLGITADVAIYGEIDLLWAVRSYSYFVLHRVPFGGDVDYFLREAKRAGRTVVFDTDDWVFDLASMSHVAALADMRPDERALYREGLERYRATLRRCDAALVSTEPLARRAADLVPRVFVHPNVASREMVRLAERARRQRALREAPERPGGEVALAYLSGTPTHRRDFAEAESAVGWVMERYPNVRLLTVGHIDVRERFLQFGARHSHLPLMPWQHLFEAIADVDVNLAPLERRNPFTECKSSIKFLEAALVGVPTIASSLSDFQRVIESERNGCLVDTEEAWRDGLRQLVESPALRRSLGARALEDTLAKHTTARAAPALLEKLKAMRSHGQPDRGLVVHWLVRAPSADGGGARTIFRLANGLAAAGHHVRVYVEPRPGLDGAVAEDVAAFCARSFGPLAVQVHVGHDRIPPADVSIATDWSTAYTVSRLANALLKLHFVQDFEPDFYAASDAEHRRAELSYELPLQPVCLGRALARRMEDALQRPAVHVDFAVDASVFHAGADPSSREGPPRILFFARPCRPGRGCGLGLAALRLVAHARPEVRIALFGATAGELGEVDFASEILGVLRPEDLAREMRRSHLALSLSLSGNVSRVLFEAMACGCAVVEAKLPGLLEMVADGETCRLAAPDAASVAAALIALVDDPGARERIARAAALEMQRSGGEASVRQLERFLSDRCFVRLDRTAADAGRSIRAPGRVAIRR